MSDLSANLSNVSPALWGLLSALSFGTADFAARFTSLRFGHYPSIFVTFVLGVVVFVPLMLAESNVVWDPTGLTLTAVYGVLFAYSMIFLYRVLARGPINVVAPIVAAHPVFIILIAFVLGSRPSAAQWLLMAVILIAIVVITYAAAGGDAARTDQHDDRAYRRVTIGLSLVTSIFYALNVVTAQRAVLILGEWMTIALGHVVALAVVLFSPQIRYNYASIELRWWGVLLVQGVLNAAGGLFLLAGSFGLYPEITALLSSEFSVVTILLAAIFLRERMRWYQTTAVVAIFFATGYLSTL
ncbi:MAG: DMT family transporter [Pseudomonadota bacterium]